MTSKSKLILPRRKLLLGAAAICVALICAPAIVVSTAQAQFNGCPAGFCSAQPTMGVGGGFSGGGGGGGGGGGCTPSNPTIVNATGAGTFCVPAGVTALNIEAWGGGGGGNGSSSANGRAGGGGGYSGDVGANAVTVTPGQTVFYFVGAGTAGVSGVQGSNAQDSWINPASNAPPVSNGVIGGGATFGDTGTSGHGTGSIGTTNFNGGDGQANASPSGGGGGAGSGGAGNLPSSATGGAGGTPDGGAGGNGGNSGTCTAGTQPGGGGGAAFAAGSGCAGANGRVKFSW